MAKKDGKKLKGFDELDNTTLENLAQRGQLVVINMEGEKFESVTVGVVIEAGIEKVWETVVNYESYPRFMPQTDSVKAHWKNDEVAEIDFVIAIKVSAIKLKIKYTLRNTHQKPERIEFEVLRGDLKTVNGGWQFIKLSPKKTLALYTVYTDLKSVGRTVRMLLSAEPLLEMGINTTTATMVVASLKKQVEK